MRNVTTKIIVVPYRSGIKWSYIFSTNVVDDVLKEEKKLFLYQIAAWGALLDRCLNGTVKKQFDKVLLLT